MKAFFSLVCLTVVIALAMVFPVFAQSSSEVIIPAAVCDGAGNCSVPVGGWVEIVLTHILPIALALVSVVYAWLLRSVPTGLAGVLKTFRADQLLNKGIEYAISMVVGASKDKKWDVALGSSIIAHVIEFALTKMPEWMKRWIGPIDNLLDMILARIQPFLDDNVDGSELKAQTLTKIATDTGTKLTSVSLG